VAVLIRDSDASDVAPRRIQQVEPAEAEPGLDGLQLRDTVGVEPDEGVSL
jgi:hypothetical protein